MSDIPGRIKANSGFIGFFSVIIMLAFVFHYPIQIVDALSSEPVPGFEVKISIWHVIFEPFIGLLLFYLRADQPFLEFTVLLIWIISLLLIIPFVSTLSKKGRKATTIQHKFLTWLKNIPLVLSIWSGLLLLIIFASLPSNTIVNNLDNTILINTHSHTEFSHDGIISQAGLQKWHKRNGVDAFFITDHNHHKKTMEAVKAQEDGKLPASPMILSGEEYSGSNHMTLLGLRRNFSTRGLTDQQVIDATHDDNGIVIVAHWFDGERKSIPWFIDLNVDGFEIANQAYGLTYDRRVFSRIVEACTSHGLIMNGAADYHGYGSACFVWNALEIPGWHSMDNNRKRESILDILRRKDLGRVRVLLYHDRNVFNRDLVSLSPVFTPVSYFRTLNFWQVLSWFIWIFIIKNIRILLPDRKIFLQLNAGTIRTLEIMACLSSLFISVLGIILLHKSRQLADYNEIYAEYGTIMLWVGSVLLVYTITLVLLEVLSKKKMKRT